MATALDERNDYESDTFMTGIEIDPGVPKPGQDASSGSQNLYELNPYNAGNEYEADFVQHPTEEGATGRDVRPRQELIERGEPDSSESAAPQEILSLEQLMTQVERMMREYEANAQYVDAERARQHLENLRTRKNEFNRRELEAAQQEDVKVFFEMVAQHQENFDRTWAKKTLEHKLRADDLIDALKWKHDDQQRELYNTLRQKRIPKFSVELMNLRKRQVLLARAKKYLQAEKLKRKADVLEAIEIDKIRRAAKQDNQLKFDVLLKQQNWDRQNLKEKLMLERSSLLEAKAQDFQRLKNRLRNAESELKKQHARQGLLAERKLQPVYTTLKPPTSGPGSPRKSSDAGGATTPRTMNLTNPQNKQSLKELVQLGR